MKLKLLNNYNMTDYIISTQCIYNVKPATK